MPEHEFNQDTTLLTTQDVEFLRAHPRTARKLLRRQDLFEWLDTLFLAGALAMFLLIFIVQIVVVDGDSMNPTFFDKERLIIAPELFSVDAGDVVVIRRDGNEPLIKRVIATEGQTVDIDFDAGIVYVDGKQLEETYVAAPTYNDGGDRGIDYPATVPENCVFVMGDNRNDSLDSRFQEIGMIQTNHIWGQVLCPLFPFRKISAADGT